MAIVIAILAEIAFIGLFLITVERRKYFISHYPELKNFYDYAMISFLVGALGKSVFLLLDLRSNNIILMTPKQVDFVNSLGNLLALSAALIFIMGWWRLLTVLTKKYELMPIIEFSENQEQENIQPGLYLCNVSNCYSTAKELLSGRAGLIISRHPPSVIRNHLNIRKTPVLWLTKIKDKNTVFPTRLEFLLQTIVDFMRKTNDPKVVFLEGIEYLILENGFTPVFKFLTTIKDYAVVNNTIVVVPLDERTLDKRELTILGREFQKLGLRTKI